MAVAELVLVSKVSNVIESESAMVFAFDPKDSIGAMPAKNPPPVRAGRWDRGWPAAMLTGPWLMQGANFHTMIE
jgi:hypothetical protein